MRFKRGSKVEVFSLKDVPFGSWQCAQIICGNGHYYTVKYDGGLGACNETLERVPRKSIRPSPPPLEGSEIWVPGDVVEVFHWFSWKMATIVKVSLKSQYLVRILGSSLEFKVSKFDMRARLCWQDGDWILIGKGYDISEDQRHNVPLTLRYNKNSGLLTVSRHLKDDCLATTRNTGSIQESRAIPSRALKRRLPFSNSEIESYAGPSQRIRVNEKFQLRSLLIVTLHFQMSKDDTGICGLSLISSPDFVAVSASNMLQIRQVFMCCW
ncbi:hypothetical protein Nepgr_020790 [Nepenthes gracilis]|uniref:Agenet domain-containing protein n=1 Tax=Nepenthes gracilis TaxID=150966 RepID=A0AAD3SYD1_NEPGR|nr:hypothetical protein Nepgr_020790 [Nepenthes gracilis]